MKIILDIDEKNLDAITSTSAKVATCSDCKNFVQHYGKRNADMTVIMCEQFYKLNCGHCIYPNIKSRTPKTLACKNFELI